VGFLDLIIRLIVGSNPDGIAIDGAREGAALYITPGSGLRDVVDGHYDADGPFFEVLFVLFRELRGGPARPVLGMGVVVADTFPAGRASDRLLHPLTPVPIDVDLSILSIGSLVRDRKLDKNLVRSAVAENNAKALPAVYLDRRDEEADEGIFAQIDFHLDPCLYMESVSRASFQKVRKSLKAPKAWGRWWYPLTEALQASSSCYKNTSGPGGWQDQILLDETKKTVRISVIQTL